MITKSKAKNRLANLNGNGDHNAEKIICLARVEKRSFNITLIGATPLIVHKFSEKQKKSIEDKQQKKVKSAREARDPHAEYLAALYVLPDTAPAGEAGAVYGFPASGLKACAVSACRFLDGIKMTTARGAFFVREDSGGLVAIKYRQLRMREDTVRLAGPGGSLDIRYRPEFLDWRITITIDYNAAVLSPEQIINLYEAAGFGVGIGDNRPERKGNNYGQFTVEVKE